MTCDSHAVDSFFNKNNYIILRLEFDVKIKAEIVMNSRFEHGNFSGKSLDKKLRQMFGVEVR